ncbi:hypothetical protein [Phenylobacterium sp.]|uniref:hypothetical protein n=1 Tax=Phenylobacterium sp. TaxID=1871053 RepID=UPI0025F9F74C|nr:hypothetical protein [Phenylobacterium sp.]
MHDVLFHRFRASKRTRTRRRALPRGYGLLLAVAVSLGLWGCIIWAVAWAFGWT